MNNVYAESISSIMNLILSFTSIISVVLIMLGVFRLAISLKDQDPDMRSSSMMSIITGIMISAMRPITMALGIVPMSEQQEMTPLFTEEQLLKIKMFFIGLLTLILVAILIIASIYMVISIHKDYVFCKNLKKEILLEQCGLKNYKKVFNQFDRKKLRKTKICNLLYIKYKEDMTIPKIIKNKKVSRIDIMHNILYNLIKSNTKDYLSKEKYNILNDVRLKLNNANEMEKLRLYAQVEMIYDTLDERGVELANGNI